jgi:organic hydroperoxide reductase OsmC/OhrA
MSNYTATISWSRNGQDFARNRYSRAHLWSFDGGVLVRASSSPAVVPEPMSASDAVDPEEAFVASLSSCHMLWFLSVAASKGYCVDSYDDAAEGVMSQNEEGRIAMTRVTLRPHVQFAKGKTPSAANHEALHEEAHAKCFIAASVKTAVAIQASMRS